MGLLGWAFGQPMNIYYGTKVQVTGLKFYLLNVGPFIGQPGITYRVYLLYFTYAPVFCRVEKWLHILLSVVEWTGFTFYILPLDMYMAEYSYEPAFKHTYNMLYGQYC